MTRKALPTSRSTGSPRWCAKGASSKSSTRRRGEDITRQVLTQIIVDEEARGSTMLPVNFLKQLIGLYGNSMQGMVPQYLEAAMDAFQRNQSAMRDAFGGKVFADIAKRNMEMFEGASRAFTNPAAAKPKAKPEKPQPDDAEIEQLRAELAALRDKVDRLSQVNGVQVKRIALFAMAGAMALGSAQAQVPTPAQAPADFSYSPVSPARGAIARSAGGSEATFRRRHRNGAHGDCVRQGARGS